MASNGKSTIGSGQALPVLKYAHIVGWGMAVPERILTNDDMAAIVETDDQWIRERTGIAQRRIAGESESTTHLAVKAAQRALECANMLPTDIDMIVVATSTPEHIFPSTASLVQDQLGASGAGAFDLSAACSGFVYALDMAASKIRTGDIVNALVIGAETMSRVIDWTDRGTCILFGDGAGAVVLSGRNEPGGILSSVLRSDGAGWDMLGIPTVGSRDTYLRERNLLHTLSLLSTNVPEEEVPEPRSLHRLHMNGREVYRFATRVVADSIREAVDKSPITIEDIDMIIPHQANQRILDHIAKQLKIAPEKVFSNVANYGNTSAASVPIALCEALEQELIKPGDHVVLSGFGGGLTWATAVIEWTAQEQEEEHRVMDLRRGFIYWYAVQRRKVLNMTRRIRAFLGLYERPDPKQAVKRLQDRFGRGDEGD